MRVLLPSLLNLLTLLALFLPQTLAARSSATSFCKCICFNNSTIIALNPPPSSTQPASHNALLIRASNSSPPDPDSTPQKPHHKLTCSDCNRAFCLDYNLPICKDAREEDVFTTCFQRDSIKDETVVVVFLIATAGLLGWALVKPWVDRVKESRYSVLPGTPTVASGGRGGVGRGQEREGDELPTPSRG